MKPKKIRVGLPCRFLLGDGLAGLVGELERPADRGRRGHGAQAAHRPQHDEQADRQAARRRRR